MRKRVWGRIALVIGTLVIALPLAEVAYRTSQAKDDAPDGGDEEWRRRYRRLNETIYQRSDDAELIYEPRPSSRVPMEYGEAFFDDHGMRDDRPHAIERSDRTRVAILGDSLVWSEFLALEQSLPRKLQQELGDHHEVLPLGVTGYDTTQEARWYERAARPFRPQIVVLVWCMNDMMIMSGPFEHWSTPHEQERKRAQERYLERVAPVRRETIDSVLADRERGSTLRLLSRALGIFERWQFDRHYDDEYLAVARDAERVASMRRAFERFGAAVRADGAQGIVVISPVLEAWDDYHWRAIHTEVSRAARQSHLRIIDPLDRWRADHRPEDLRISGDNLHYGEHGNEVLAGEIADAVRVLSIPR
jgi:lysophospholipase L1-like esterase